MKHENLPKYVFMPETPMKLTKFSIITVNISRWLPCDSLVINNQIGTLFEGKKNESILGEGT
ncbi:hypothetical protein BGV40_13365 [Methanosarcina sp. Ant1]|nr:hypothetical protein BGV40_13365 [Methanosarcina sp. Ant1]